MNPHSAINARSLAMDRLIAQRLRREPGGFGQSSQCFGEMDDIVRRQRAPGL
jgi:hypothetical protein